MGGCYMFPNPRYSLHTRVHHTVDVHSPERGDDGRPRSFYYMFAIVPIHANSHQLQHGKTDLNYAL